MHPSAGGTVCGLRGRRVLMKRMILAAIAVLSLGVGSAYAQSFAHEAPSQGNGQGHRQ
jgi:hypothetical protein